MQRPIPCHFTKQTIENSSKNGLRERRTDKTDQRDEGMALILAAVAEDVNRMFSHESPLLLTFGMIAQAHLHQNFIAFHTEIGDWAGKKPAVLSELDESMMALLEILENGCANVKEMTAMLLAVREEERQLYNLVTISDASSIGRVYNCE